MSYYTLPKNINNIYVNPKCSNEICSPYLSISLLKYYQEIKQQIITDNNFFYDNANDISNNYFDEFIKIINPYEYIFSKVPGSKFSVSKLKPTTNLFYDLLEIYNNIDIFDNFKSETIKSLHISPNHNDSLECFEMMRENSDDEYISAPKIDLDLIQSKFDYIFFETENMNNNNYFYSLINCLLVVLKNQKYDGVCIIKINEIFHKPVVDFIYFLSSLYDKVHITKPNTNNITSFDRYIVCKGFAHDEQFNNYLKINYLKLYVFLKKFDNNKFINEILDYNVPYYFKNKIDDLNIIIGQQQIDSLDKIISIYKNKNKDDKIESIKKSNIQKSVTWCEKYKIPCNKFTEKINIFLPIVNDLI